MTPSFGGEVLRRGDRLVVKGRADFEFEVLEAAVVAGWDEHGNPLFKPMLRVVPSLSLLAEFE